MEKTSLDDVLAVLDERNDSVTGTEVGDELGISNRSALDKLHELHERGAVERKKVGGAAVVWWLTDDRTTLPADQEIDPAGPLFTGEPFATDEPTDASKVDEYLYGPIETTDADE